MRLVSFLVLVCLSVATLSACGSNPTPMDADGLRDRADQETNQVR